MHIVMKTSTQMKVSTPTIRPRIHRHSSQEVRAHSLGFTLIELMVSLGIFSIVMTIAASSYISAMAASQYSQSSAKVVNSLANVLNNISNEIRNGSCGSGLCTTSTTGISNSFSFKNADGKTVKYSLSNNSITRTISGASEELTDPKNVNVKSLNFLVNSYSVTPSGGTQVAKQFWIIVTLSGKPPTNSGSVTPVYLETGVTLRQLTIQ